MTTEIRAWDGVHYLCAEPDGRVVADRTAVGPWEQWTVERHGDRMALKSAHGRYLTALDEANAAARGLPPFAIAATADYADIWEMFTPVRGEGGGLGLRTHWGRFVVAEEGGGGVVGGDRLYDAPGPWESFRLQLGGASSPAGRGIVRPESGRRYFATDAGRVDWRELSSFALLALIQAGRHAEARAWINSATGEWRATAARTFLTYTIGGPAGVPNGGPDRPDFWPALDALIDMAGEAGLLLRLTIFAALEPFGATWDPLARRGTFVGDVRRRGEAFAAAVAQRVAKTPHVLLEIANEGFNTGFKELSEAVVAVGRIVAREAPDTVLNATDINGMDREAMFAECFDCVSEHFSRDMEIRGLRGVKRMGDAAVREDQPRSLVALFGEPHNMGEWRVDGRNGDVVPYPIFAYAYAALCRARQILPTFHYDGGLYSTAPQPQTRLCLDAFHRALDAFPMTDGERWRGQWGLARGDYWRDVWPTSDDPREVEAHVRAGRGPWRANGIGPWSVCFPEPKAWDWRANAEAAVEQVDRFEDDAFGVGIYRRLA